MNCLASRSIVDSLDPEQASHDAATEWMAVHRAAPLATAPICAFEVPRESATPGSIERKDSLARWTWRRSGSPKPSLPGTSTGTATISHRPRARDALVASHATDRGLNLVTPDRDFEDVSGVDATFYG